MRISVANNIKIVIPKTESAKEFLKFVGEHSQTVDKSLVGTLMDTLTTMKFDGSRTMHEHVVEMTNIAAKLKTLGIDVNENFLVQFILNSLPTEYGPFQMNYNTMKDKWNVHELHSMLVQEETRLNNKGIHCIHYVNNQGVEKKKYCLKRKAWYERKGKPGAYVYFESNLAKVPYNTWWIDSGCTTHVSNMMQGFLTIRNINPNEKFIFMGNRIKVPVEVVKTYRLILDTGYCLHLYETFYVPSISRNLVSLSKLDVSGYTCNFNKGFFNLFKDTYMVGCGMLCDGLYKLKLDNHYAETLLTSHDSIGTKRSLVNERFAYLWHKRLGHISKERLEKLVKSGILPDLDFTDFDICVNCIKGKQTRHTKKEATRSTQLLEIIHMDICGPFDINTFSNDRYCITFIDDFSRYGYVCLLHDKSQAVKALEIYVNEVERKLDKKVKIVRSDREGEYYGRYNETGQLPDPFLLNSLKNVVFVLNTQYQAEIKVYNPQEKKLDARTISGNFIGYPEKSKGYIFYCPNHVTRIVETRNASFIENDETSESMVPLNVKIKEITTPAIQSKPIIEKPQEVALRQSQREKRSAILDDYVVYLQESDFDLRIENDPVLFSHAISCDNSDKWMDVMKEELKSMEQNEV
ncbi:uncharacterized protein LOC131158531 [Malania oleifera]|uniref:uncharacterized protein LOC131158531 n=1 Tax=Malania oleifera TaxID=397392 RepID=UPI0025AE2D27|nr:uncharacterized protein LOC131158531 [Malania oleifera]